MATASAAMAAAPAAIARAEASGSLAALGLELQWLSHRVLASIADGDTPALLEAVERREQILDRLREMAQTHAREVAASAELREAARQEAQIAAAAHQRMDEIRHELQNISQRIALRQTYSLTSELE
jgi:hypothetical protein